MISAIVLAAGSSVRMGRENKLLLPFAGEPLLRITLKNIIQADTGEVIVVTGHAPREVEVLVRDLPVSIIYNPDHLKGMTTSIQTGIAASSPESKGFMVCLSDMPHIQPEEYRRMADEFLKALPNDPRTILIPQYRSKSGNPAIFSHTYRKEILLHKEMEGCRQIVKKNQEHLIRLEMDFPHILRDIDTPEDYQKLISQEDD